MTACSAAPITRRYVFLLLDSVVVATVIFVRCWILCAHRLLQWFVCRECGSLLSPVTDAGQLVSSLHTACRVCDSARGIEVISVPYVFRYLVNELAAMNIRSTIEVR